MNRKLILLPLLLLAACSQAADPAPAGAAAPAADATGVDSEWARTALAEVREEMRTGDLPLESKEPGLPKAVITPEGDLVIDGQAVAIDEDQRALLLAYRSEVGHIAETGAQLGLKGVELAGDALGEAAKALFTGGDEAEIEARVEAGVAAKAEAIKADALALCARVPDLLELQDRLSESLPEFRPYARMDASDVECDVEDADEVAP